MTSKKHCDIIKKWADGAEVQWYNPINGEWKDVGHPGFYEEETYRIKHGIIRIALHSNSDNQAIPVMWHESIEYNEIEKYESFIQWLTGEIEYEM